SYWGATVGGNIMDTVPIVGGPLKQMLLAGEIYNEQTLPRFYIITGYTTIISYLCIGMKCARYLAPKFGERIYLLYGAVAFIFFSFMPQGKALLIMSICGAALLILNLLGIFRLRDEILYEESELALQESK
nr:cytochrome b N-terminal domain-containing protein [Chlamydiota bacterium]